MLKLIPIILLSIGVSACGYHLSGSTKSQAQPLASVLKQVSFEGLGKYDPFRQKLVFLLGSYGIRIMKPGSATARIIFLEKQTQENVVTVGDDAKAREYLLTVSMAFTVKAEGKNAERTLLEKQVIQATAPYIYDPNNLLVSENERRRALDDIENRLAQKLMDRVIIV